MSSKKRKTTTSPSDILQKEFSYASDSKRVVEHGIVIGENIATGNAGIDADITTALLIGKHRHVLITNLSSDTVYYVTFGDSSVATASASNGIPILPFSQVRLCSGENEYIRANNSNIHCVEIAD